MTAPRRLSVLNATLVSKAKGGQAEEGTHTLHGRGRRAEEVVGEHEQQMLAVR